MALPPAPPFEGYSIGGHLYLAAVRRVIAVLFLLTACSAKTPAIGPTSNPSPTPSISTSRPAARVPAAQQAVYARDGSIFTYDVKTNAVTEVARGQSVRLPRWVSANEVSFVHGEPGAPNGLRMLDLKTRQVRDLFTVQDGINAYGWSPDRQTVAYITTDRFQYPHLRFYEVEARVGRSVATLARAGGREFHAGDQISIDFSANGSDVLVVYTPADGDRPRNVGDDASQLQIRALDGSQTFAVDHARDPTHATWSSNGKIVYYVSSGALRSWTQGGTRSVAVPGSVRWFNPWPSPAGRRIAFDTGAVSTSVKVRTLDVRSGAKADVTKGGFFHPVWANANVIWVQKVAPCGQDCPAPVIPAPEVFAVDVRNGKQTKLALTSLEDIDVRYV